MKFGDLSNDPLKDYVFDIDKFASFEGKTGPYIGYTGARINSLLKKAGLVDFENEHYEQRIIKSPAEIEVLKTNWEMVSNVFTNVVPKIEVGMTERYIEGMFVAEMMKQGAESYVQAFAPMVAV